MAFLSEDLEEIHNSNLSLEEKALKIGQELKSRVPSPEGLSPYEWLDKIKCIDNSYRYFCKQHHEYKLDGFRNQLLPKSEENDPKTLELHQRVRRYLNW